LNFDTASSNFKGTFLVDTSINAPTIVFKSDEYYYQNGYDLSVSSEGVVLASDDFELDLSVHNYISI